MELEVKYTNGNFIDNDKLYEFEQGSPNEFKKGSLRLKLNYWKEIEASDFIVDVIENGHRLPFLSVPRQGATKSNKSALCHSDFGE